MINDVQKLWLKRMERVFLVFSVWFGLNVLFILAPLVSEFVTTAVQTSYKEPFLFQNWQYVVEALLSSASYSGFTFIIASVLRGLAGEAPRFQWNENKIFRWSCGLYLVFIAINFYIVIEILINFRGTLTTDQYSFLRIVYTYVSTFIPLTFNLALISALYVFYTQFNRLKQFESEVI